MEPNSCNGDYQPVDDCLAICSALRLIADADCGENESQERVKEGLVSDRKAIHLCFFPRSFELVEGEDNQAHCHHDRYHDLRLVLQEDYSRSGNESSGQEENRLNDRRIVLRVQIETCKNCYIPLIAADKIFQSELNLHITLNLLSHAQSGDICTTITIG